MADIKSLSKDSMISLSADEEEILVKNIEDRLIRYDEFKNTDIKKSTNRRYTDVLRGDKIGKSLPTEEVFKNTDHRRYSYFDVGTVVDEEDM